MNHVYRVIWNRSAACWQAVSETARGQSKSSKSTTTLLKPLLITAGMLISGVAVAAPTGGAVTSGTASIGVSGSTTTINQSTAKAIINWNDFSIASGETVNFVQPDANAIALNRVVTATPSSILGNLNANGQVFIVNPNGITFGSTAQVNVGGLVASTLDISDSDFNNGTYRFANSSNNASITNQGAISVANTGTAALIAPSIQQAGSIVNNDGSILLTAASDVTLSLTNRTLNSQTIHAGHNTATVNHSAGTIQADGGKVILTAQGVNSSSTASISSAGSIRAQTLAGNDRGAIDLISDMASGAVSLTGTLDASAPTNGFGGTIRTIGADVAVSNSASVTTRKVNQTNLPGTSSYWQIKANSINVGSGGTISGSELSSSLNDGSVTLSAAGTASNQGTININDAVSSNSNVIFGLAANKDINFNNNVGLTANLGRLVMSYGSSNDYNLNNNSKITLSGAGATLRLNSTDYTIINSLGVAGDTTTTTLQGMKNNLTGNYALGSDIDASSTSGWNSGAGFDPIGEGVSIQDYMDITEEDLAIFLTDASDKAYKGKFHGLGHEISDLYIDRPTTDFVGLFAVNTGSELRNISLIDADITGGSLVGALSGANIALNNTSKISNASVTGNIKAQIVGGLVGFNAASQGSANILNSHSFATVEGVSLAGGLVAVNIGVEGTVTIANSSASGYTLAENTAGGLVAGNNAAQNGTATIIQSSSSGTVQGKYAGGLAGANNTGNGTSYISNSSSSAYVKGELAAGGLVSSLSVNRDGVANIIGSYATGNVEGGSLTGGLIGVFSAQDQGTSNLIDSYSSGSVTSILTDGESSNFGGLIGSNEVYAGGTTNIINSHSVSTVVGGDYNTGGLVGRNMALDGTINISKSYATGSVTGGVQVGGFAGYNTASEGSILIDNSYAIGDVTGSGSSVGGFAGAHYSQYENNSLIDKSYATGLVIGANSYLTGGFVGSRDYNASVTSSFWDTTTSGQSTSAGGTGKTTAELKQIATFTGWDIADVSNTTSNSTWVIDENNATPWLR
jgi:filamentous hemagglutinin family protein